MSAVTVEGSAVGTSARAAVARAVLARAEERTGTGPWVRPVRSRHAALPVAVPSDTSEGAEPSSAAASAPWTTAARHPEPAPAAVARLLPVLPDLAALLPSGALDRGSTVVVSGSTSLTLGLVAEASRTGSWTALVGLPAVGVLAAYETGLVLDRVVLVPDPGPDGATVVAALLDGVDVVVVGPQVPLTDADRRRLSARARERSAVLLPTGPWPGAHVVLTAQASRWDGLGRGYGRLRSRRLTVERSGRGSAAQTVRRQVTLPLDGTAPLAGTAPTPTPTPAPRPLAPVAVAGPAEGRRAG